MLKEKTNVVGNPVGKADRMRDRLIDAAIESVYRNGFSDTTVAKISEIADVSTATVHHHFTHKEDLLEQAMSVLLEQMRHKVVNGCTQAEGPRGKLWAVIQAVLGEEQSNDRAANVWLAFWVAAEHFESLRRVRNIYTRRLYSNVRGYLRQILLEIGAPNPFERTEYGTLMIISVLHGSWLSFALKEEAAQDLERCRLMVWECLEMLLSRARENLVGDRGMVATSSRLLNGVSLEMLSADIDQAQNWHGTLNDDSRMFVPHFRNLNMEESTRTAGKIIDQGMTPVAHVAARNIADENELERIVAGFTGVGVHEFLLLGGGEATPAGKFENSMQLLQTGIFQHYNARKVGFAGHPEEHPAQPRDIMRQALLDKLRYASAHDMEAFIVTQFCFAVTPYFDFLDWLKSEKISVPVRLGIAGRVGAKKLFKYAAFCGIGRSVGFFRRQFGKTLGLVNFSPEGIIAELAGRVAVRQYDFPISLHFYPFGAVRETLAVISEAQINGVAEVA
ncbi:transcriptional regulator BetI [Candidatus Persebacteraceae bacterium Df01]|jgi:methylenetetrahydrofolate reductase (NADPH)|uniref:Transcriptional regulator BetI n=1 Tax=Candidatus Doriopsillibacter californiensis TaxID=2970740 RepID=A0ABT7QLJ9_9GAMM|nr:transcriptional regulator BetI [Candidatus Persebacteraceae bacterium Df01]